jgi:ribonucrease Y
MNIFELLKENFGYLLLFLFFLFIILFYFRKIYQGRLQLKNLLRIQKKLAEKLEKSEKKIEFANEKLVSDIQKVKETEKKLQQEEERLLRKEELFTHQLMLSSQETEKLQRELEKMKKIENQIINDLGRIIPMSSEEAEKKLFSLLREKVDYDLEKYKEEKFNQVQKKIQEESTKIICLALEKYSSELVFPKTTNILQLENRQIVSKIIGKEGRNINTFRRITGTEVIIDSENDNLITIQISSFNSLRREIALRTFQSLIREERFSPAQIEKTFQEVSYEIGELMVKNGEEVLRELELTGIHPELVKFLGKLKYRTSYGQNVLEHSLEVAKLAGNIAAELNLDIFLARRAGLFHDIGKAVEDNEGYSHVINGINLAKKYKEPEVVINAIAAHHRDYPTNNFYSLIVIAADKLSAARPGARGYQLEAYVERMNSLESIAKNFPGIKKSYAFQAGREVWVIADAEKLTDQQT